MTLSREVARQARRIGGTDIIEQDVQRRQIAGAGEEGKHGRDLRPGSRGGNL